MLTQTLRGIRFCTTFGAVCRAIEQADACYVSVPINCGPDCIVPIDRTTLIAALERRLRDVVDQRGEDVACFGWYDVDARTFTLGCGTNQA